MVRVVTEFQGRPYVTAGRSQAISREREAQESEFRVTPTACVQWVGWISQMRRLEEFVKIGMHQNLQRLVEHADYKVS